MKNIVFLSEEFPQSIQALQDLDTPIATTYRIYQIVDEVQRAEKRFQDLRIKLIEKYCDRHEEDDEENNIVAGQPVIGKDRSYQFNDDDKIEKFNKEFNELVNIEFEVSDNLTLKDLGKDCKIAAKHLAILEALFSDLTNERKKKDKEEAKSEEKESDNGPCEKTA